MSGLNKFFIFVSLLFLLSGSANGQEQDDAIFVVHSSFHDIETFTDFSEQIARLKPFGRIDMNINSTAEKADFEMPEGGSPWHEYAAYDRSLSKFFPDEKMAPFIPESLVVKNRQLLLGKVKTIRDLGLSAGYRSNEPHFLTEAFFESYPHLRGPRVDHPRRGLQKEFADFHGRYCMSFTRTCHSSSPHEGDAEHPDLGHRELTVNQPCAITLEPGVPR